MREEGEENEEVVGTSSSSCCASCGIAEVDDIKLKECDGCDLVKYCSAACMEDHKSEHEEECKKRASELRDELLFLQPESTHMGDCPICMIPLPIDAMKSNMHTCCSKLICNGCYIANLMREMEMGQAWSKCPFCREPAVNTDEEESKRTMKRIEIEDPVAMSHEGGKQYDRGDYNKAFDYLTMAVTLTNDAEAHYHLSIMYNEGLGVEKDEGEFICHAEEAAIGGHPVARHNLGAHEWNNDNTERALKHWIIAATQGFDLSMKELLKIFKQGYLEKDVLAATLRAHKAAVDTTRNSQRDTGEKMVRKVYAR